jgi:DNA transformation protein and related proteins
VAVTPSFQALVVDQLSRVVDQVRAQRMFGGVGIYSGACFFALIAEDTLYFKVDDTNRADFEARQMEPFQPYGPEGEVMQYYQVPDELLEDVEALRPWALKALAVAARKPPRRPRKRRA